MPRSNTTGGKGHKKAKKHRFVEKNNAELELKGKNQVYGQVKTRSGGTRVAVECSDKVSRSAVIPGKFYKKIFLNEGDILLCEKNTGGDDSMCYITHKYNMMDAIRLKQKGEIMFDIQEADAQKKEENNYDEEVIETDFERTEHFNPNKKILVKNTDLESSESEDDTSDSSSSSEDSSVDLKELL